MRITIEINEQERAATTLKLPADLEVEGRAAAVEGGPVEAIDAGPPPASLIEHMAGAGATTRDTPSVSDATDAGSPPAWLVAALKGARV